MLAWEIFRLSSVKQDGIVEREKVFQRRLFIQKRDDE